MNDIVAEDRARMEADGIVARLRSYPACGTYADVDVVAGYVLERAADEIVKLRRLVEILVDNDPDDGISDAGHTVLDMWRHDARRALGRNTTE